MVFLILCTSSFFANGLNAATLVEPTPEAAPSRSHVGKEIEKSRQNPLKKNKTKTAPNPSVEASLFKRVRKAERIVSFAATSQPKYPELDVLRSLISVCNLPSYPETIAGDARDLLDFFDDCKKYELSADAYLRGIRQFHNRAKACEIIDDTVMINLLDGFSSGMGHLFARPSFTFSAGKNLKNLYTERVAESLYTGFDLLRTEPTAFVKKLARELERSTVKNVNQYEKLIETRSEIRSMVSKFFEHTLSKTMWNYLAYQSIWPSVLSIAHGIHRIHDYKIITNENEINDLYWSLTYKFCFFIDFIGSAFPKSFYDAIENDINNGVVGFLDWEEPEHKALSKRDVLCASLTKGKMKAIAMEEHGIFSDVNPTTH